MTSQGDKHLAALAFYCRKVYAYFRTKVHTTVAWLRDFSDAGSAIGDSMIRGGD